MTILTTQKQIAEASTADLIATYNHYTGKAITRFSSRSAGESQTAMAILKGQDNAAHAGVPKGTKVITPIGAKADPAKKAAPAEEPAAKATRPAAKKTPERRKAPTKARKGGRRAEDNAITQMAKQVTKQVDPVEALKAGRCPLCNGDPSSQTPAGKEGTVAGDERRQCHDCGQEYWIAGTKRGQLFARRKPGRDASSAIRDTWSDEDVRAARSLKQRVTADGVQYRSVREAFKALSLPLPKHVKFRMELKAAGRASFTHPMSGLKIKFVIITQQELA